MKKYLILALLAFFNLTAFSATAYSSYNPITGDHYKVTNHYGNTRVYGHNHYTGNRWKTKIDSRGNIHERGVDAYGNSWKYKTSSNHYGRSNVTVYRGERRFSRHHPARHHCARPFNNHNKTVVSVVWSR